MVTIELAGEPRGKGRPRFVRATGHAFTPATTRNYEAALRNAAADAMAGAPPIEGPVRVLVRAYMQIPASWSKKKHEEAMLGIVRPTGRPDWENIAKMLDAFNTVVWRDDAQVVEGSITKHYDQRPRLVVKVEAA